MHDLTDPRRTIPAGKTPDGLVHRIYKGKPFRPGLFYTSCGIEVQPADLLLLLQRPEDITCPACADSKVTKEEITELLKSQPRVMAILPPESGCCQVCGTKHDPADPHNKTSLYYQMKFHQEYGRWPTWEDAMRHCTEETKTQWREQLRFFDEKLD